MEEDVHPIERRRAAPKGLVTIAVLAALFLLAAPASSAPTVNACASRQMACVATFAAAFGRCHAAGARKGRSVDPVCIQKSESAFIGCMGKAERKGNCLATGAAGSTVAAMATFVGDVASAVAPGFPAVIKNTCVAGKHRCVAAKVKALLTCRAKAARKGFVDLKCLQRAIVRFDGGAKPNQGCFAKLERKGGCPTTGDTPTLAAQADAFVVAATCTFDPASPGCPTPTPEPTATGATPSAPTVTATASIHATPTPVASCPTVYQFTLDGENADQDIGWTGRSHDAPLTSNVRYTLAVGDCVDPAPTCGTCTLAGPLVNAGGPVFANRRCRGGAGEEAGSWTVCASDADCPGAGNACVYFGGPPQPVPGPLPVCVVNEIASPITGTIDLPGGDVVFDLTLRASASLGISAEQPCPSCVDGTCQGGVRDGEACTPGGRSALFGQDESLDCPPSPGLVLGTLVFSSTLATGTQSRTLDASRPPCTGSGATGLRCFCDTCAIDATPCSSDADCGSGACGGKRCKNGPNAGASCTLSSECPSGSCVLGGAATEPNACTDRICTANTPPDDGSINEGVCAAGPFDQVCNLEPHRTCTTNAQCPAPGDVCVALPRECFTDNGVIGESIRVGGVAGTATSTLGGLGCVGFGSVTSFNTIAGLPGLARVTLPGVVVLE